MNDQSNTLLVQADQAVSEKSCGCGPDCDCGPDCACGVNGSCNPACTCGD